MEYRDKTDKQGTTVEMYKPGMVYKGKTDKQ